MEVSHAYLSLPAFRGVVNQFTHIFTESLPNGRAFLPITRPPQLAAFFILTLRFPILAFVSLSLEPHRAFFDHRRLD